MEKKLKNLCKIEIILFLGIAIGTEVINQYFYKGVFQNYLLVLSIPLIILLIRQILVKRYSYRFMISNIIIGSILLLSILFTLPSYTINEATHIVLNDGNIYNEGISSLSVDCKTVVSRTVPSVFTTKWYVITVIQGDNEINVSFNPDTGIYSQGKGAR